MVLNVVLLVPLGMLLAYRYRKPFWYTVAAGLGVSLLIEITQGTGAFGLFECPYRLADVDDLILNTAGAAAGWLIVATAARWLRDSTPTADPDVAAPTVRRRMFAFALDILTIILASFAVRVTVLLITGTTSDSFASGTPRALMGVLDTVLPVITLTLLLPTTRADRATLGQLATWLGATSAVNGTPASTMQLVIRFAIRWLPIIVGALAGTPLGIVVVGVVELTTVILNRDRRSLSGLLSGTTTVTRRTIEARNEPSEPLTTAD